MFLWSGWRKRALLDNPGSLRIRSVPAMRNLNFEIVGSYNWTKQYINLEIKANNDICKKSVLV